jgi:hypothetical protein
MQIHAYDDAFIVKEGKAYAKLVIQKADAQRPFRQTEGLFYFYKVYITINENRAKEKSKV